MHEIRLDMLEMTSIIEVSVDMPVGSVTTPTAAPVAPLTKPAGVFTFVKSMIGMPRV